MDDALVWVIARGIRAERARIGMSQEALGRHLGLSRVTISEIETARRRVWADELPAICKALGVQLEAILSGATDEDRRALGV